MHFSRFNRRLAACLAFASLTACEPQHSPATPPAAIQQAARGSVWVVEGKQGGRLFLCGTIHILREQDYPLAEVYDRAYELSNELILELPPGALDSGALAVKMMELGKLPPDEALDKLIGKEDWARVQAWAKKRGMDKATIQSHRPWYLSLIMVALEYAHLGATPDRGVEQEFEVRAEVDGKPGKGLETVEFQLQLFAGMSAEQEKEILRQTLDELETVEVEFERMIRFWKEGNMDELQALLMREAQQYPDLMEAFLAGRNRAWLPQLEEVLDRKGSAMVLVGAGHLGGPEGLIALFEEKGYRVRHAEEAGVVGE